MRARTRDRRVYLRSHPVLFALLAATRRWPVVRLGRTVLVHDRRAFAAALTDLSLDRTASGTTGGAVSELGAGGGLFDEQGATHRESRRSAADGLNAAGVARLRPIWTALMAERLAPLAAGHDVDLVPIAADVAGATAAALLSTTTPAAPLAAASRTAAATAAREHLPGPFRRRARRQAQAAAAHLATLVAPGDALHAMLAVAAINTTVAALPRAAAWAADDALWDADPEPLAAELLRVIAPTPLLPRAAASHGTLPPGHPIRTGDRLLLIARHAAASHRTDPDPVNPAPHLSQLVFGVGPHACPGARLARAQMTDWLTALAAHRPVVVRARADRRSALPGWRCLVVRAGDPVDRRPHQAAPCGKK